MVDTVACNTITCFFPYAKYLRMFTTIYYHYKKNLSMKGIFSCTTNLQYKENFSKRTFPVRIHKTSVIMCCIRNHLRKIWKI